MHGKTDTNGMQMFIVIELSLSEFENVLCGTKMDSERKKHTQQNQTAPAWELNHQFHQSPYNSYPGDYCPQRSQSYRGLFSIYFMLLRFC